jgi:AcrR family transcriptional regulator
VTPKPLDQDKPEAILDAALELFVERGFHGTAVPLVAERAGVATGTLYHYFDSKEALVNALYRHWKGVIGARVIIGFPVDKPPREQFRIAWERMAEFVVAHPREFAFLELHHHRSYLDEQSLAMESQTRDFVTALVKKAQSELALKAGDPAILMAVGLGAFIGVFREALEGRIALTRKSLMAAEQCVWEAIRR